MRVFTLLISLLLLTTTFGCKEKKDCSPTSEKCRVEGLCELNAKNNECIATKDAHCAQSVWCKRDEMCIAKYGACHDKSTLDE